jgi:malonyl-CoA/methylmalonyl-CoA synthetase
MALPVSMRAGLRPIHCERNLILAKFDTCYYYAGFLLDSLVIMPNANLYELFSSRFNSSRCFIRSASGEALFSYHDLASNSAKLANCFQGLGLNKGDRVMVQVEKSPQALFVYFACLRAGLIFLPLNTAYRRQELQYFVDNAEPSLIISDPASQALFAELSQSPVLSLDAAGEGSVMDACVNESPEHVIVDCQASDIATIIYTSGTTGKPKGAMISHGNLAANGLALAEAWGWRDDDVMLHALPIFHIHGLFIATHLPILHSSPIIFLDKYDPQAVISLLPEATVFMGVPTHYVRLLDQTQLNRETCRNIRVFTSGSAPMLVQTHKDFKQRAGYDIVERYGMTEAGIITTNPIRGGVKIGTVGKPMPGVELRIRDEANKDCSPNTIGSIQVRGASIFQGYWRMPEKTKEEFTEDGYFITGDLGSADEEGFVSISGRGKDLIISGGLNIYPKEIETEIDQIPGVLESAVIGLPHRDFGEAVTAVVVKDGKSSISENDIIRGLKENIASFKVPKAVFLVDALPRNAMGKVQKNLLRDEYTDRFTQGNE